MSYKIKVKTEAVLRMIRKNPSPMLLENFVWIMPAQGIKTPPWSQALLALQLCGILRAFLLTTVRLQI